MRKTPRPLILAGLALSLWWGYVTPGLAGPVEDQIREIISSVSGGRSASLPENSVDATILVPRFYEKRGYKPAWHGTKASEELLRELNNGLEQGFRPKDFHLPLLFELREAAKSGSAEDIAAFDVVASDAAAKLIHHLIYGKVDPAALDSDWNYSKPVIEQDPAEVLNAFIDGSGVSALMERIAIAAPQYQQLVDALAKYRSFAASGGWRMVPDADTLEPGIVHPAVEDLRNRLSVEIGRPIDPPVRNFEDVTSPLWVYDQQLEVEVRAFQARHGLEADGVVGARTFASLNRTAEERVDQIRLSLERARWVMRGGEREYVLVNIAGARTYFVKSDGSVWTTRSITGSEYRKTPVFRDEIEYMEFNPTWTVPSSIFLKDKLPRIRKDIGYLERNNYIVRSADGSVISPYEVNWAADRPRVTLVQNPGPDNALGLIKFMFPNKHSVYLHDTNDRSLFARNERNLSSGCVRLEYPFEFASLLMEGAPSWSYARMQAILESGKTTRVNLPVPIPVLLMYWTAWVENGEVHFREDPYGRDAPILEALDR
ncbi:L,D-transpeptidase family protein [Tropicimonas marinistellae]|uniref:L,D-transpeptidase family protein n=1 Tax=Tropicimonas marinistellae TaxID=1739787 RepID=UPI00098EEAEB|nr:L,D-transpeptidase family protein [Tropicimonas marinistellae]